MDASIALPNLDPAINRSRVENLLSSSLGNAVVAAFDYFHLRDMTARIQEIASVGMHLGVDLPRFVAASHAYRLIVCSVNDGMRRLLATQFGIDGRHGVDHRAHEGPAGEGKAGLSLAGLRPRGDRDDPADRGATSRRRCLVPCPMALAVLSCAKLFGGNSGVNFGARPAPNAHARAGFSAYPELESR